MAKLSKQNILDALSEVKGPDLAGDLVSLGLVSEIVIRDDMVAFSLSVDPSRASALEPMRQAAEKAVSGVAGVKRALVTLTAEQAPGNGGANGSGRGGPAPRSGAAGPPPPMAGGAAPAGRQGPAGVPGVKFIIAVASGKGGVGKSTTAVNLALALLANGHTTGILDADIYGPSMPRLLGVVGKPDIEGGTKLKPLESFGLKVMSMGFLVEEDTPMIWRGPMVISALTQMLREVDWGELDVLIVDMPPGTGDAQLTMAQQVPLAGAVIVSTPQDLALIDARKGLNMFRKVDVPVLGIVENMSYFLCPKCGERSEIFGHGGARAEAEKLGVRFLGEVPLDRELRVRSDSGQPIVASAPGSPHTKVFLDMADALWQQVEGQAGAGRGAPKISVE